MKKGVIRMIKLINVMGFFLLVSIAVHSIGFQECLLKKECLIDSQEKCFCGHCEALCCDHNCNEQHCHHGLTSDNSCHQCPVEFTDVATEPRVDAIIMCRLVQEWNGVIQYGSMICKIKDYEAIIEVNKKKVLVTLIGVGPSKSTGSFAQLLLRYPNVPVCLVGVAGAISPWVHYKDVLVPRKWVLINYVFNTTDSSVPPYTVQLSSRKIKHESYQVVVGSNQANDIPVIIDIGYGKGLSMSCADFIIDQSTKQLFIQAGRTLGQDILSVDNEAAGIAAFCYQYCSPKIKYAAIRVISDDDTHEFDINEVQGLMKLAYPEFVKWLYYATSCDCL